MDRGVCKDLGRLLEGSCRQEGIRRQSRLRDTEDHALAFRRLAAVLDDGFVGILEVQDVHEAAGQERRVAALLDADLLEHLADDHLDVLVADIHALQAVDLLDFAQEIVLHGLDALDLEKIVRVDAAFRELIACCDGLSVEHLDAESVRDRILFGDHLAGLGADARHDDFTALLVVADRDRAAELGDHGKTLRLTRLEQLLDTGKTLCDIAARDTAGVECTHRQLCAGLTDGLCGDDADGLADLHHLAGRHVGAVALRADAVVGSAGEDRADLDRLDLAAVAVHASGEDGIRSAGGDHVVALDEDVAFRVADILAGHTADDPVTESFHDLVAVHESLDHDAGDHVPACAAVGLTDDQFLGDVDHSAGQVTGVRGTERGVGQTLSRAVCRHEVLQNVQAFAEVRLDGQLDRTAGRIRHQSAHSRELLDLLFAASRAAVRHHVDVVVLVQAAHQDLLELFVDLVPGLDDRSVSLLVGELALEVAHLDLVDGVLRALQQVLLLRRNGDVRDGDRHRRDRGVLVAHRLDLVEDLGGAERAVHVDDLLEDLLQILLLDQVVDFQLEEVLRLRAVHHAQILGQDLVEQESAEGREDHAGDRLAVRVLLGDADMDLGVQRDDVILVSEDRLIHVAEVLAFAGLAVSLLGQVVDAQDHIL